MTPQRIHSAETPHLISAETKSLFRTAREVAAETPDTVPWVVEGYLAEGAITELDGKLKASGKTTLLMAMVAKLVEGEPFLDRATSQTGVVILTEQNPTSFRSALARAALLERDDVVVLFWADARDLPWPVVVQLAAAKAKELEYRALIVDTLSQFARIVGDAENSSGAALEAMRPLQEAAADGLAVLISRHERKGGGEVGESARGSSAFSGAVDIVLSLRRAEGQTRETVRVIQALSRFDETPSELVIDLVDGEYRVLGTMQDVKAQEAREAVLDELPGDRGRRDRDEGDRRAAQGLEDQADDAPDGDLGARRRAHGRRIGGGQEGRPIQVLAAGRPAANPAEDSFCRNPGGFGRKHFG